MNGRTALGACLVLLAILAGALFLDRSQRLVPVYAAARDLPAGTPLAPGDLMVIRVGCRRWRSATTCGRAPTGRWPAGSSPHPCGGRRSSQPASSSPPAATPTWSSCRSRSTRETWPRVCGPATACRCWPPTPTAPAGAGRSSCCRPPRSSRSSRTPPGSPAADRNAASSSACRATAPRSWPRPSPPPASSSSRPRVRPPTRPPPGRLPRQPQPARRPGRTPPGDGTGRRPTRSGQHPVRG